MNSGDVRFDLYFTGQLADGVDRATAQTNLARLFRSTPEKMAGLFNGRPQRLKQGLSREEAQKYKVALTRAGLVVAFKSLAAAAADTPAEARPMPASAADWSLAPPGSDLLHADERPRSKPMEVDISGLSLSSPFLAPEPSARPAPAVPDTSRLSVAALGADLTDRPAAPPVSVPDTSALTLAPAGSDLEPLKTEATPVSPDISGLSLAPAGSAVMPEGARRPTPPPAPDTSHLQLSDEG
ncbi:MAG TPA: hypothetical protein VL027_05885 [Spongiibacteraceae bacterium]|jgi:hypothetical protein|nr:hypothetical protein [Spongiibacteraceae bacterium]HUH37458.1 hypothetical protein [Spongiibacteraceae bacterium]